MPQHSDTDTRPPFCLGWRLHGDGHKVRPGEVDFGNPINLMTGALALIIGVADIALGSAAALVCFHLMRGINLLTHAMPDPMIPAADGSPDRA